MIGRRRVELWTLLVAALVATICGAPPAFAGKKECAAAYVQAQELKQSGAFKKAREQLLVCAKDECMAAVKKDCVAWLDEVNASLPSIVIEAKGPDGKETFDVKVTIDGEVVGEKLDVKAIEVDPGTHKIVLEYAGQPAVEQELILRQGQKNKTVEVSFEKKKPEKAAPLVTEPEPAPDADAGATDKPKPPVLAYVLGGVGVVALAGTAYFWLGAESKKKDLEDSGCSPNCAEGDVDSIKDKRLFGDVALGVGVACLGAATWLYLSPKKSAPKPAAGLDLRVGPHGAFAGYAGRF